MSSKVVRLQWRRKPECSEATATMEAKGEEEEKEWVAEPEHGVLITLMPLPNGGNQIKKIRFRYQNGCFLVILFLFFKVVPGYARGRAHALQMMESWTELLRI